MPLSAKRNRMPITLLRYAKALLLLAVFFTFGVILSYVITASGVYDAQVKLFFEEYILRSNIKDAGGEALFSLSFWAGVKTVLVLFASSATVLGIPMLFLFSVWKGFSYGCSVILLFRIFGIKALLLLCGALLPHLLLTMPVLWLYAAFSLENAKLLFKGFSSPVRQLAEPLLYGGGCLLIISIGALIAAFLEPRILSLVSGLFLT